MFCSKYGGECTHSNKIFKDDKTIFVLMPFNDDFNNTYESIKEAINGLKKDYECLRADESYTNRSIWCENICQKIRKAKYIITDITDRNPNVFYELGLAHALNNTDAIIITQNIADAPFDIKDLGLIQYKASNLRELKENLKEAIVNLDKREIEEINYGKSSDELIIELKNQIRKEEDRTEKFKKQLIESEDREDKLHKMLDETRAIKENPTEEAKKKISELEDEIAKLKSQLSFTEEGNEIKVKELNLILQEKENKLIALENKLEESKKENDEQAISDELMDETSRALVSLHWFNRGRDAKDNIQYLEAIKYYDKAIELNPDMYEAWYNKGLILDLLGRYEESIMCYNNSIELKPDFYEAQLRIKIVLDKLKIYDTSIKFYNRITENKPDNSLAIYNLACTYSLMQNKEEMLKNLKKVVELDKSHKEMAKTEESFREYWNDPDFLGLVNN